MRLRGLPDCYAFLDAADADTETQGEVLDRACQASGLVCVLVSIKKQVVLAGKHADGQAFQSFWVGLSRVEVLDDAAPSTDRANHAKHALSPPHWIQQIYKKDCTKVSV